MNTLTISAYYIALKDKSDRDTRRFCKMCNKILLVCGMFFAISGNLRVYTHGAYSCLCIMTKETICRHTSLAGMLKTKKTVTKTVPVFESPRESVFGGSGCK